MGDVLRCAIASGGGKTELVWRHQTEGATLLFLFYYYDDYLELRGMVAGLEV